MLQESVKKELVRANASKNRMVGGRLVRGKVALSYGGGGKFFIGRRTRHFQRRKLARESVVKRINEFRNLQESLKRELVRANASAKRENGYRERLFSIGRKTLRVLRPWCGHDW